MYVFELNTCEDDARVWYQCVVFFTAAVCPAYLLLTVTDVVTVVVFQVTVTCRHIVLVTLLRITSEMLGVDLSTGSTAVT